MKNSEKYDLDLSSESKITENENLLNDHKIIKGFFRQISDEKSGLSLKENNNNKSIDSTKDYGKNSIISKTQFNPTMKTINNSFVGKQNNNPLKNSTNNFKISLNQKYNNNINKNFEKKSNNTSKKYISSKNEIDEKKQPLTYSVSKINSIFGKLSAKNELQKSNNNIINVQNPNQLVNQIDFSENKMEDLTAYNRYTEQLFCRSTSLQKLQCNTESITSNERNEDENSVLENLSLPTDAVGNHKQKFKVTFTKKLFKLFLRSGQQYESKKNKIITTTITMINDLTVYYVIDLITILSLELIMSNMKIEENVQKYSKLSIEKSNTISSIESNDKNLKGSSFNRFVSNQRYKQNESEIKKCNFTFDYNGRLVSNDSVKCSSGRFNTLNHNSLSNLSMTRMQMISQNNYATNHAFSSHYNLNSPPNKQNRVAFNSQVQQSIYKPHSLSKVKMNGKKDKGDLKSSCINFNGKVIAADILENGRYRIAIPIKSNLDFTKLNDIFLLKDELNNKCNNSIMFVKPRNSTSNAKVNKMFNQNSIDSWNLHIESATSKDLIDSLQLTALRFPDWNLGLYIDKL